MALMDTKIKPPALLVVLAHPDDESFPMGGTLAKYAAQGAEVTLVCATRGEAGIAALTPDETPGSARRSCMARPQPWGLPVCASLDISMVSCRQPTLLKS